MARAPVDPALGEFLVSFAGAFGGAGRNGDVSPFHALEISATVGGPAAALATPAAPRDRGMVAEVPAMDDASAFWAEIAAIDRMDAPAPAGGDALETLLHEIAEIAAPARGDGHGDRPVTGASADDWLVTAADGRSRRDSVAIEYRFDDLPSAPMTNDRAARRQVYRTQGADRPEGPVFMWSSSAAAAPTAPPARHRTPPGRRLPLRPAATPAAARVAPIGRTGATAQRRNGYGAGEVRPDLGTLPLIFDPVVAAQRPAGWARRPRR